MDKVRLQEFMDRKGFTQQDLAKLFNAGMFFSEAFGDDVKLVAKEPLPQNASDSMSIVAEGLQKILDAIQGKNK